MHTKVRYSELFIVASLNDDSPVVEWPLGRVGSSRSRERDAGLRVSTCHDYFGILQTHVAVLDSPAPTLKSPSGNVTSGESSTILFSV